MNLKNIAIASVAVGGLVLFSAFGGNKITLDEQMKAIDAAVSENVASFESSKRAECKAMAVQKAIGIAEAKMAEAAAKPVAGKKAITPVKKAPVKKAPTKPTPAPTVKPTPAPTPAPKNAEETTGRRVDPAKNAPETQTTGRQANPAANTQETQTTGRRKNN